MFFNATGSRKRRNNHIIPIKVYWRDDTHFVEPMCGVFQVPCPQIGDNLFDVVDIVTELDYAISVSNSVIGDIESFILVGLLTNAEKFGQVMARKQTRGACKEEPSSVSPKVISCKTDCEPVDGEPYMRAADCVETPCPPGTVFDYITCGCIGDCTPCPPGYVNVGSPPNCGCEKLPPCSDGRTRMANGECPPSLQDSAETCFACEAYIVEQWKCLKCVYEGDMAIRRATTEGDGCPISTFHTELATQEGCGKLRVVPLSFTDTTQLVEGAVCDETYSESVEKIVEFHVDAGDGLGFYPRFAYTVDEGPQRDGGGFDFAIQQQRRIISMGFSCRDVDTGEVLAEGEYHPNPPYRIESEPIKQVCTYDVKATILIALLAVRYDGPPGIRPPYKNIDFRSLPKTAIPFTDVPLGSFSGPCRAPLLVYNTFLAIAGGLASRYLNQYLDILLVAAFGPVGGLVGSLVDVIVLPRIIRR